MMKKPKAILIAWMQIVNNRDVESLFAPYHSQALLIPTFFKRLINTTDKLRKYFEKLGSLRELSIALHEKSVIVRNIQHDICTLSGFYNWYLAIDGGLLNFEARSSYMLDLAKPIPNMHHHF
jgi:hypothetical protein